ncbi:interleukin-6 receptor subunit alpha [Anomaloglossus baeobatrachus]|uniref:interleukin-6 receptor subunit alpha n=1 Tax=Anomaloglossus baeobatrachus TaxID=238106 RepID=UPI003F4F4C30
MAGTSWRCTVLIIGLCCGRLTTSYTQDTLCPKPAISEDAILVTFLSDVNLTCAGCDGQVFWSHGSPYKSQRPLEKAESGHLVLRAVAYDDEGNYTCYKDGAPVCTVELLVRDQPQEGTSLSCYNPHPTHNITCEWSPTELLHPFSTATLVKVRVPEEPLFFPCTYDGGRRIFTCSSLHNEADYSKQVFLLCVRSRTDSVRAASLEANWRDLLHIGPPLNVQVTKVEKHPRRLEVRWSLPEFWEEPYYRLKYQVLYQVENSLHQSNGTTDDTSFIIHDAVMRRQHLIRVRATEEYQENWGSWSKDAKGVPWSDGATMTQVPNEDHTPTPQQPEDPENEVGVLTVSRGVFRSWIAPGVSLALVILFLLGLWIRYQEVRMVKLHCGFLRSLVQSSSIEDRAPPPPVTESLLSSVVVTVPPLLEGD